MNVLTLVYYVLTPLHIGSGRGGRVDIVIQRDAYGIPIIYSSSIKGTIKSFCLKSCNRFCESEQIMCRDYWINIFGGEVEFVHHVRESKVVFTDAYPLAFPVSHDKEIVYYVTSPYLLKKIYDILELCQHSTKEKLFEIYSKVRDLKNIAKLLKSTETIKKVECIYARNGYLEIDFNDPLNIEFPVELVRNAPYPINKLPESLIIVPDKFLIEKLLNDRIFISTRIAIEYDKKSTRRGYLWREEYVPTGTVFIGAVLFKEEIPDLEQLFRSGIIVVLGGRETIGKGFVKIQVI